jgi:hypothetical protein
MAVGYLHPRSWSGGVFVYSRTWGEPVAPPTVQNGEASGGDDVPRRRRKSPHRGFDFQAWKDRQPDFEATVREAYESLMRGPDAAEAEEALSGHRGRSGMDWPGVYRDERAMAELLELRQRRDEEEEIIVMLLH